MRFLLIFIVILIFFSPASIKAQDQFTVSGTVIDSASGESAIGALVFIKGTNKGISTNLYGFYSLTLPKGEYELSCSFIGYKSITKKIKLDKSLTFNFKLSESTTLAEVVITADKDLEKEQIRSTQMSAINIPIEQIKNIPTIGGETDIIKVMQLMPGVKRGDEGQNGMFVRGGNGDDNLILLDEATVYNISHLFGFFSVFNNDALKDITLYKGGFPAQYGGRLSSVMDIRMKDGDMQKFKIDGGIGLLSSHITVQGPIKKDKMSFLVSGRRSYIDQVVKAVYHKNLLPYYFYDGNLKLNYILNDKDRLYLSAYYGDDVLKASGGSDSGFFKGGFKLGNYTMTGRWNHVYNSKLFSNVSIIHTRFRYDVEAIVPGNSFLAKSRIADIGGKLDYNYYRNPENTIKFGLFLINHTFRPNVVNTAGEISDYIRSREGNRINTQEFGGYANNDWRVDSALKINYGLRYSNLVTQGVLYAGLEPRLSLTWAFSEDNSLKFGYARMKQYLHLVSSSAVALPTDLWYPATKRIRPLSSDQLALSYNRHLKKMKSILTIEGYYKWMRNMIDYREGAVLILNDNYENELVTGKGWAYGAEVFLSKTKGRLTGWIGYTISWSRRQFKDLNHGRPYYAKYDKRHDISVVASYEFTKRFSVSAVWVYSTGQRFTAVIGNYVMPNSSITGVDILPIYGDKNSVVLPASHRLDLSLIFKTREGRKIFRYGGEWHLGAYNVYNRAQPQRVEIVGDGKGGYKYQAVGIFGFIPFIAYNFKI
ncbi:MAG: TonB-dependent receptor [Bacteroidia bacterium]